MKDMVRLYYGPRARRPRREGDLAIEIQGSRESLQSDIEAGKARTDIGRIWTSWAGDLQ